MKVSTFAIASAAFAQVPNRNEVAIKQLTVNGSGCPAGSVEAIIADDLKSFTLLFSKFIASSGPTTPAPEKVAVEPYLWFNERYEMIGQKWNQYVGVNNVQMAANVWL